MKLGTENRKQLIAVGVLGRCSAVCRYEFTSSSSTNASTALCRCNPAPGRINRFQRARAQAATAGKKEKPPQSLDPTLHLGQLAVAEQIEYQRLGKKYFCRAGRYGDSQAASDWRDRRDLNKTATYTPPPVAAAPPIPLKFFGFASHPGEPKKIFLSKGEDVFIAGEGEIVDRRYKVV